MVETTRVEKDYRTFLYGVEIAKETEGLTNSSDVWIVRDTDCTMLPFEPILYQPIAMIFSKLEYFDNLTEYEREVYKDDLRKIKLGRVIEELERIDKAFKDFYK